MKKILLALTLGFSSILFAESIVTYKQVKVISSKPIMKTVTIKRPYTQCRNEYYNERRPIRNSHVDRNSVGVDTLIGTAAGAVLGHQIGKGNGNVAAKIVGGLSGGYIANQMREGSTSYSYEKRKREICQDNYNYERKEIVSGYKNTFKLKGKFYSKISEYPLEYVQVKKILEF